MKNIDGLKVPASRRRASFFHRFRYGGTTQHKRHQNIPVSKIKREVTAKVKRENSFHVSSSSENSSSKGASFSWAKMSAAGTSEEDRLSTISSKDGSEEVKRKHSIYRRDFGCQTEPELMDTILNMPYLRRRCSQRIQRTKAIDEDYASVKFSPNNSMKVRYSKRMISEPIKNGKGPAAVPSRPPNRGDCRTFLFPGYSESPLSTSDDIENEEEFEYYDSISDLLKAHKITPMNVNDKTPVCVNDKSMSTYLNPLGNRDTNDSSVDDDTDKASVHVASVKTPESEDPDDGVQLVVENCSDGTSTSVLKDSQSSESSLHAVVTIEDSINSNTNDNTDSQNNPIYPINTMCNESPPKKSMNSINVKRRSSSPIFTHVSCHSLNISDCNDNNRRRPSALSQGSHFATRGTSAPVAPFPACKSAENMSTTCFANKVKVEGDKSIEEKSMLEFQTFLRERGVELDMNHIESSDV